MPSRVTSVRQEQPCAGNNQVAITRDVPALVTEVGNEAARIYVYHYSCPKNLSLVYAIHQMSSPRS